MAANALGLGPVAVIPAWQRQGIGKALAINSQPTGGPTPAYKIKLLGDSAYYTQFGFSRAADFGLGNEYQVSDEFMVIELSPGTLENFTGMVTYAPEFKEIGV